MIRRLGAGAERLIDNLPFLVSFNALAVGLYVARAWGWL